MDFEYFSTFDLNMKEKTHLLFYHISISPTWMSYHANYSHFFHHCQQVDGSYEINLLSYTWRKGVAKLQGSYEINLLLYYTPGKAASSQSCKAATAEGLLVCLTGYMQQGKQKVFSVYFYRLVCCSWDSCPTFMISFDCFPSRLLVRVDGLRQNGSATWRWQVIWGN